jgi:predicted DNA-binding helix-hairpin-helix protein
MGRLALALFTGSTWRRSSARAEVLDLAIDPKLAWALSHRDRFPVDVNKADRESLLRVPGLGARTVARILTSRRHAAVRLDDLARLRVVVRKVMPFIITADHRPRIGVLEAEGLRARLAPTPRQLNLFAS